MRLDDDPEGYDEANIDETWQKKILEGSANGDSVALACCSPGGPRSQDH